MKVAILTSGRFHVGHLARELSAQGHDVQFYSMLPRNRTRRIGLERSECRWLGWVVAPFYLLDRGLARVGWLRRVRATLTSRWVNVTLDWYCSLIIKECDVLISMSGMSLRTIRRAQSAFGAVCFLERSSQHIEAQKQILDGRGAVDSVAEWTVRRELLEYEEAHKVVLLSSHCVDSFIERGFSTSKLRRMCLGVDLDLFPSTPIQSPSDRLRVLFVGIWCVRKGCDLLEDAVLELDGIELTHVGALGDLPFPEDPRFVHHDPVQEQDLPHFYRQSDVFVLPSREDGFGMVLLQAIASGRRVITSDLTGGPDLVKDFALQGTVTIFSSGSTKELTSALREARDELHSDELHSSGRLEGSNESTRDQLGWSAYAARYEQMLLSALEQSR